MLKPFEDLRMRHIDRLVKQGMGWGEIAQSVGTDQVSIRNDYDTWKAQSLTMPEQAPPEPREGLRCLPGEDPLEAQRRGWRESREREEAEKVRLAAEAKAVEEAAAAAGVERKELQAQRDHLVADLHAALRAVAEPMRALRKFDQDVQTRSGAKYDIMQDPWVYTAFDVIVSQILGQWKATRQMPEVL